MSDTFVIAVNRSCYIDGLFLNDRSYEMNVFFRHGVIAILAFLPLTLGISVTAANEVDAEALAEARALLKSGREQMVREEMFMTESESAAFWPIYEQYRDEVDTVRDRQAKIIAIYVEAYWAAELGDELAEKMLEVHFLIENDLLTVEEKYVRRFRKAIATAKVTRFYQLENKLDAEIDVALAQLIPLYEAD